MSSNYSTSAENSTESRLDRPFPFTRFKNKSAGTKFERVLSLRVLAAMIERKIAPTKEALPWTKLARFGEKRTPLRPHPNDPTRQTGNSLRHDANVIAVTGAEADYDGELMQPEEAVALCEAKGLTVLIHDSSSWSPNAPRWRVFAPFGKEYTPSFRYDFLARLNGVLGGILAPESFTLSQAYYGGSVEGHPKVRTFLVEGTRYLDEADDLDAEAIGRRERKHDRAEHDNAEKWGRPLHVLRDALMSIPNDAERGPDRSGWVKVGAAVHFETDGAEAGFSIFDEWSRQWPGYVADMTRELWGSLRRKVGSVATGRHIRALAEAQGWTDTEELQRMFGMFDDLAADEWAKWADTVSQNEEAYESWKREFCGKAGAAPESGEKRGFRLLAPEDCERHTPDAPVIKGLIAERNVVLVTGDAGVGKSVLTSHLAYAVSQGRSVFGRRVRKGGVLYVAAEAEGNMIGRVRALRRQYGDSPEFLLVVGAGGLRRKTLGLKALKMAIDQRRPKLVVIDTLAAAFPGIEENTSEGMGEAVAVFRQLAAFGPAVLVAHHTTKAGGVERGHSSLAGDVDATIILTRDNAVVTGKTGKNRNEVSHQHVVAYVNQPFTLGLDEDGDPITTVICKETEAAEHGDKPPRRAMAALSILCGLFRVSGEGVTREAWRDACVTSGEMAESEKDAAHRQGFKRAVDALLKGKHVEEKGGLFFPIAIRREEFFTDGRAGGDDDALI